MTAKRGGIPAGVFTGVLLLFIATTEIMEYQSQVTFKNHQVKALLHCWLNNLSRKVYAGDSGR